MMRAVEGESGVLVPALSTAEARDRRLHDRFAAAFGTGAADAWSLLADPAAPAPSGSPSPAERLRAARSGLYRRTPTGRDEYDRVLLRVLAERRAALAALAVARQATPAPTDPVTLPTASPARRPVRRPVLVAAAALAAAAATAAALIAVRPAAPSVRVVASPAARVAVAHAVPLTVAERSRVDGLFAHAATDPVGAVQLTQHLLGDAAQVLADDGALAATGTTTVASTATDGARQAGLALGLAEIDVPHADGDIGDTLLVVDLARATRWRAVVTRRSTDGRPLAPLEVAGSAADGRVQVVRIRAGVDGEAETVRISAPGVRFAFAVLVERE